MAPQPLWIGRLVFLHVGQPRRSSASGARDIATGLVSCRMALVNYSYGGHMHAPNVLQYCCMRQTVAEIGLLAPAAMQSIAC